MDRFKGLHFCFWAALLRYVSSQISMNFYWFRQLRLKGHYVNKKMFAVTKYNLFGSGEIKNCRGTFQAKSKTV